MEQIAIGVSKGFDAREVARNAAQQALLKLGTGRPSFAICFISHEFNTSQAISGLTGLLGNIPLWGMNTHYPLNIDGELGRSVIVAIVSGRNLEADAQLLSLREIGNETPQTTFKNMSVHSPSAVLLAGDGPNGLDQQAMRWLKQLDIPFYGGLSSGDFLQGETIQFANGRCEAQGLALLALGSAFKVGAGLGHGWQEIGFVYQISQIEDKTIHTLDGISPAKVYETIFGFNEDDWQSPAFSEIIPLYPLGIEVFPGSTDLFLRTPIAIDADGSFRLNAPATEGQMAHVMVGDIQTCLEAVKQATEIAARGLQGARPLLAVALIDYAWHLLFGERIKEVFETIQNYQKDIPVIGAYTLGHIHHSETISVPQIINQNIMVLLIGEKI